MPAFSSDPPEVDATASPHLPLADVGSLRYILLVLYMVIEHFKTPGALDVYRRARDRGRMLPEGLRYHASWVSLDYAACYQLMETDQPELFDTWKDSWKDLVDFEIVPVRPSAEAIRAITPLLG